MSDQNVQPTTPLPIHVTPEQWMRAVHRAWRSRGYRMTEPRNRVLESIAGYTTPFSAEQLYADLQHHATVPGRATVYRALEQLVCDGWVVRIHGSSSESSYSVSWPGHIHHIVCTSCHKVVAFEGCDLHGLLASLIQQTRFTVEGHLLEIYGRCPDCQ